MTHRTLRTAITGIATAGALILAMMGAPAFAVGTATASISGTVTLPAGVDPTLVQVEAITDIDTGGGAYDHSFKAWVQPDGTYVIDSLPAGGYRLFFDTTSVPELAAQFWGGSANYIDATHITLGQGQHLVADQTLTEAASITGSVAVPTGIDPTTVSVTAYKSDDSVNAVSADEPVNADGSFSIDGLLAGSYKVYFFDSSEPLAPQWWQGVADFADATPITLSQGGTATASAALTSGASVSGTVTGLGTSPYAQACAYRVTANTGQEQCGHIASTGKYTISGLRSGDYKVRFWPDPGFGGGTWKGQWMDVYNRSVWWNDQPGFESASVLSLTATEAETGVDDDVSTTGGASTWPIISGTAKVGQTLTATPGMWPAGTQLRYSWYSTDNKWDADTTAPTITLPAAVAGKTIGLTVWGNTGSVQDATYDGTPAWQSQYVTMATKVAPATLAASTPTVAGTAGVGFALTARPGSWTAGTSFSYAWYANGVYISGTSGSTHSTFKPTSAQKGKQITVRVTGVKAGYTTVAKTSARTAKVALSAVPTVTGLKRVGLSLTAHPGVWTTGTKFSYRWYANGVAIAGATHGTFTPTAAQRGKTIKVAVTGTLTGYATVARTSASTSKIS